MSGILLIIPAMLAAMGGPLLSLGLAFVPPPYGIASAGILCAASTVFLCIGAGSASGGSASVLMAPVFLFITSLISLAITAVGWIFALLFNTGKIVSIVISSIFLLLSSCCLYSGCNVSCQYPASCLGCQSETMGDKMDGGHASSCAASGSVKDKKHLPSVPVENEAIREDRGSGCISVGLPVETSNMNVTQEEQDSHAIFLKCLSRDDNLVAFEHRANVENHGDKDDSDVEMGDPTSNNLELQQKHENEVNGQGVAEMLDRINGDDGVAHNDGLDDNLVAFEDHANVENHGDKDDSEIELGDHASNNLELQQNHKSEVNGQAVAEKLDRSNGDDGVAHNVDSNTEQNHEMGLEIPKKDGKDKKDQDKEQVWFCGQ